MSERPLTFKQQRFVDLYLADKGRNGAKAARDAGYAVGSADVTAAQLLRDPRIIARVQEQTEQLAAEVGLTARGVLEGLAIIANGDAADVEIRDGWIAPREGRSATVTRAVKSFQYKRTTTRQGSAVEDVRVEMHDPVRAQELSGRRFGILVDQSIEWDVSDWDPEDLERLVAGEDPRKILASRKTSG